VTTDVARAIVDLNRAEDDRRTVKTQTYWGVPVYRKFPPDQVAGQLLDRYCEKRGRSSSAGTARGCSQKKSCVQAFFEPPLGGSIPAFAALDKWLKRSIDSSVYLPAGDTFGLERLAQ